MLTSARNTLYGTIASLKSGAVQTEVVLSIGSQQIVSTITNESVERLQMKIGDPAYALIKSSSLILAKTKPERISARNVLHVSVEEVIKGAVNAEVKLLFGDATMNAIITNDSCDELMIKKGYEVYAIVKASSVIVGMV
ncbi:MAG: TOBE domain-containing protein [Campylobacterales bacterium]|nr:TOBE domain-containing protein [Campylobacterales bacterium]